MYHVNCSSKSYDHWIRPSNLQYIARFSKLFRPYTLRILYPLSKQYSVIPLLSNVRNIVCSNKLPIPFLLILRKYEYSSYFIQILSTPPVQLLINVLAPISIVPMILSLLVSIANKSNDFLRYYQNHFSNTAF